MYLYNYVYFYLITAHARCVQSVLSLRTSHESSHKRGSINYILVHEGGTVSLSVGSQIAHTRQAVWCG